MIEVFNNKNKRIYVFTQASLISDALRKLSRLHMRTKAKYLLIRRFGQLSVYYCDGCKRRSYFEYPNSNDIFCNHCKISNKMFFVGFKSSEREVQVKYVV